MKSKMLVIAMTIGLVASSVMVTGAFAEQKNGGGGRSEIPSQKELEDEGFTCTGPAVDLHIPCTKGSESYSCSIDGYVCSKNSPQSSRPGYRKGIFSPGSINPTNVFK
jgi:hypothetical protein